MRSSLSNALDKDNIRTLCLNFSKFLDGLKPTVSDGDFVLLRKEYFFSKFIISALSSSNSLSEIAGALLS